MSTINVQFSDSTEETIIATFNCAQSPSILNQGEVSPTDARYHTYYAAQPTLIQQCLVTPQ